MARLRAREFLPADLDEAAELLCAAHVRAQDGSKAGPRLGPGFFDVAACRRLIEAYADSPHVRAAVVEDGSHLCGYLMGEEQRFGPQDFPSLYAEPHSVGIALQGHAVAADVDAAAAYEALYAFLARHWVSEGYFVHNVSVSRLDPRAVDAWSRLGFGYKSTCALRATRPLVPRPRSVRDLVIEEIRGSDDERLEVFHRALMTFQRGSPMFWPYDGQADATAHAVRAEAFESGQAVAFIAGRAGRALGSMLFVPAVFLSPLLVSECMAYLWEGFVEEGERGAGVGSVLLDHAFDHLQRAGVHWCALHFVAGNPRGGHFWPAKGFVPIEVTMKRQVDERIGHPWTPRD